MAEGKTKIYYAWRILLICFILMFFGHAANRSLHFFLEPIRDELGWSVIHMAGFLSISGLLGGVAGLVAAPFIDRLGPRRFILLGFPLVGIGFIVLSFVNAIWMLYIVSPLVGLGVGIALYIAPHTVIAHWFKKRRCFALSLLLAGSVLRKADRRIGH